MNKKILGCFFSAVLLFTAVNAWCSYSIVLENSSWKYIINTDTLDVALTNKQTQETTHLTDPVNNLEKAEQIKAITNGAEWYYPSRDLSVRVAVDAKGLEFNFSTHLHQILAWPQAGSAPQAEALVIPDGEGLYVPTKDSFWLEEFKKYPDISLLMPFWGVQYGQQQYVSYMFPNNNRNHITVNQDRGQLYMVNHHEFLKRDQFPVYTVLIHLTGNIPISPAVDYREWLIAQHDFVPLSQKMAVNPNVQKLLGAFHVWVFGDGLTTSMLREFRNLAIDHLWLGYDPTGTRPESIKNYVESAENMGYLVAPYDSFSNAQNPSEADNINSVWRNNIWTEGCIRNVDDSIQPGYAKRGCDLSSEALKLRESQEKNIEDRVSTLVQPGDNSYFVDSDAAYPLYDDYSKTHSMTQLEDENNRLARLKYISIMRKLVLGSEDGLSWSNPAIAFNNGSFSTFDEGFWIILKDQDRFGDWKPEYRPGIFFKPYEASSEFITASYDPRYRLPLYEAALHDSVVSTDRWELSELKIPALMQVKPLLESLYNVPAIWALDLQTLKDNANRFASYYQFFSPLHRIAGTLPLTYFKWLTPDHLVQQTQFGDVLVLTANFSDNPFEDINSHCIKALWKANNKTSIYCPTLAGNASNVTNGTPGDAAHTYRHHRRYYRRRRWRYY